MHPWILRCWLITFFASDYFCILEKKLSHKGLSHGETLEWFDAQHQADTIHRLHVFRKSRKFCDLKLMVSVAKISAVSEISMWCLVIVPYAPLALGKGGLGHVISRKILS